MNILNRRLLSTICVAVFSVCLVIAQTDTTKHIVERGETLVSIAKRYATTEAKIIELNPNAAQFVYVGMELTIPKVLNNSNDGITKNSCNVTAPNNHTCTKKYNELLADDAYNRNFEVEVFVGLSLNNFVGKDSKNLDMSTGFHAGILGRYYFVKNTFLECSLGIATKGYKSEISTSSGDYWVDEGANYDGESSTKYRTYNLEIPVLIGYNITINDYTNIKIKVGPYMTYAISGKLKTKGYNTVYPDIHSSETEYIEDETDISDIKGLNKFGYGLQTGISANFSNYVISAYYQRSFMKRVDDVKQYEQNILVSLGYKF